MSKQSVKMTDIIKPFVGVGDVVSWIKKVKLVAKLQNVKQLENFMPLYLEGDALALYLQLSEQEQANADLIEAKLLEAFTDSPFVAFRKLSSKRWDGEQVDVFANELMRLGGLAGFCGEALEKMVKLTFVNGFPDNVSCELQQTPNVMSVGMSELISRARILVHCRISDSVTAIAVDSNRETGNSNKIRRASKGQLEASRLEKGCFKCGGPHLMRNCHVNGGCPQQREIICFRCRMPGHIASRCDQVQGNGQRVSGAPAATQSN